MRVIRFVLYGVLILSAALLTAVVLVARNQTKIAEYILARIYDRTGFEIRISGTRLALGTHLVVILEHPRVITGGTEVAQLKDLRAVLTFRALLHNNGLPLYKLTLDQARVTVPVLRAEVTIGGIPQLETAAVQRIAAALEALSDIVAQVDVVDGALADENHTGLVEHLDLRAHHRHRRQIGNRPWLLDFSAGLLHPPLNGLHLSGHFSLNPSSDDRDLFSGRMWFWGLDVQDFDVGPVQASAKLDGNLATAFDKAGALRGNMLINVRASQLRGARLRKPVAFSDYAVTAAFDAAPALLNLSSLSISQGTRKLIAGGASLTRPFERDRTLRFTVSDTALKLMDVVAILRSINGLPAALADPIMRVNAGDVTLEQLAMESTEPLRRWSFKTLRDNLSVEAVVRDAGYQFPPESKLGAVRGLNAQINYSAGMLNVRQASFGLGNSRIEDAAVEANLKRAPSQLSYKLRLKADLDLAEAYRAAADRLHAANPKIASRITTLSGHAPIDLNASGDLLNASGALNDLRWQSPRDYRATITLRQDAIAIKGAPASLTLADGRLTVQPGIVKADRVRLLPSVAAGGYAMLNGTVATGGPQPSPRMFTAELHRMAVEDWLPLIVPADALAADGAVGGVLTANTQPGATFPVVTGKLTLGAGHLQLGFLRSPIVVRSAALTLSGASLDLELPGATLEGSPLNLSLKVSDLAHPAVRLDATAAKLDFEVMTFIRLPWSPHQPPHFFNAPVSGHIDASQANFDKLPLAHVSTDFTRDAVYWHVDNFRAKVFEGGVKLSIAGESGPSNWIHILGKIADMNAGAMIQLATQKTPPALTGRLFAHGDLWANTDTDFFDTLAGTASIQINNGRLDRFTLLSRILGLLAIKNWLTAKVPDPRLAGLPFTRITGDLKGVKGDFYTDNLRLDGPVMEMTATGDVEFGPGLVNLQVGVIPFSTANWIVHQIPIVGGNLASGSHGLVAAYFQVEGSFRDPAVTPKPITSVAEFVKKMLSLPINIIAPDTIK